MQLLLNWGRGDRQFNEGYPGFNLAELYFIPKDSTMEARKTRPIAASNTCNRIIANVVRAKIEGPILDILSSAQAGFVRNRSIEENIRFYNARITAALSRKGEYNLLLLDFAKAFDSVSRRYLLKLLIKIGIPLEYAVSYTHLTLPTILRV